MTFRRSPIARMRINRESYRRAILVTYTHEEAGPGEPGRANSWPRDFCAHVVTWAAHNWYHMTARLYLAGHNAEMPISEAAIERILRKIHI